MAVAPAIQVYGPPQAGQPFTDESWRRWFNDVLWPLVGKGVDQSGPQGSFPQLQVGKARFTGENAFQDLLSVDQGLYVNYSSTAGDIVYGFASNVYRAVGSALTVGGQFSAYAEAGVTGGIFGGNINAFVKAGSQSTAVALELDTVYEDSTSLAAKWGLNLVFFDNTGTQGLGSNLYNYGAEGIIFTAGARSSAGEYCGWNTGIDFLDGWCDQSSVPAWSATVTYRSGQIVSSGGVLYKAITASTNSVPPSAAWIQHTASGTTNLAVGIDFSSMSLTSMGRMSSAIRLRSTMNFHWDETASIASYFDAAAAIHYVTNNTGTNCLAVGTSAGVGNLGVVYLGQAKIANGGGAAPTLGTIGGSGPTAAAQAGWMKVVLNGTTGYLPVWV